MCLDSKPSWQPTRLSRTVKLATSTFTAIDCLQLIIIYQVSDLLEVVANELLR